MKKIIFLICIFFVTVAKATETIKIYSPYSSAHSGTPALLRIVDEANNIQSVYKFVVEFRPGGNQIIAVKALDANSLAIIAPAYVDNVGTGKLNSNDYIPVYALGDACWVGITNVDLLNTKELVVGGVGIGNATHLTALGIGEKYKFDVRYIVFKSNNDALINMAGNNGINFVIDKYEAYQALRSKNPNLKLVAASCPTRIPQEPNLKTFKELGIDAPFIFNTMIANTEMPHVRRIAIAKILREATDRIGEKVIFNLSAMKPPQFYSMSVEDFHARSVALVQKLQLKFKDKIKDH